MKDKVQLIKQEIERKREDVVGAYESEDTEYGYKQCCKEILNFIDSLPEEPASEDLIEEIDKIWKTCNPIDEGMGVETANIHIEQFDDIARHFAEWKKQKAFQDFLEKAEEFFNEELFTRFNGAEYRVASNKCINLQQFIEQFKNYIQDESKK